jgi:large subunit ribosomal protein L18e
MLSKTTIKSRARRKTNLYLSETIREANKNKAWAKVASIIAIPTRMYTDVNLKQIDEVTKAGDTVLIPGKVLSSGNLSKKVRICSFSISESAKEKLAETKSEYVSILQEIKENPKCEGIKVIR